MITVSHAIGHLRLGAGRYVVDTAVHQARSFGYSINVLVSTDAEGNWRSDPALIGELKASGIPTHVVGDFFHRDLASLREAAVGMSNARPWGGPWLAHAHTAMAAAVASWAGADSIVATCHGWDPGRPAPYNLQDALTYRLCDAITSPSAYWARKVAEEFGVPMPWVVPVGLNLNRYPARKDFGQASHTVKLVTVCELTPRKGVDVLIRALPGVWERHKNVEFHVIGDGVAAGDLRCLAAQVDPSGSRIRFLGPCENPYSKLASFDLFVLASRSDNLPVALIEALFARLPVVATRTGGVPEIVDNGRYGVLVPPDSPEAMTNGLLEVLAAPQQVLESAAKGEQFSRVRFNVETTAASLDKIYRQALSARVASSKTQRPSALRPGAAGGGSSEVSYTAEVIS